MTTYDLYYTDAIRFVKSLVIKIDEIRIHQNYHNFVKYNKQPPTLEESKYYQNITGNLNKNDFTVLYKDNILTRDFINNNKFIKTILTKYDTEYDTLVLTNPGMSDYIKGCLTDLTMSYVIEADNYKILHYDTNYLESNELSIIPQLENFIRNYFTTYNNRKYMIDELFLSSQLGILYNSLVLYLLSLKYKNIKTNRVDKFHITSELMSYNKTYLYSNIFDLPTNIWLYGNIDRLKSNIGKNKILEEVLDNVLNKNNYGISNIIVKNNMPTFNQVNFNDFTKEFYDTRYSMVANKRNESFYSLASKDYTVNNLNDLLYSNTYLSKISNSDSVLTDNELKNNNELKLTNIFLLDRPEKIRVHAYNMFVFTISNLIDIINNNNVTGVFDYFNNVDSKLYKLNIKDIEQIIVYSLYKLYNITTDNFSITCYGLYNNNINKDLILSKTWYKNRISKLYDYITDIDYLNINVYNKYSLNSKLKAIRQVDLRSWFLLSNIIDNTAKTDIKYLTSEILYNKEYNYTLSNVEDYLTNNNLNGFKLDVNVDNIVSLVNMVTGLEIDSKNILVEKFNKIIKFFDNFTSYTVNLAVDNSFLEKELANSTSSGINMGYKPFLQINSIEYKLYDELNDYVRSTGFLDTVINYNNPYPNVLSASPSVNALPCLVENEYLNYPLINGNTKLLNGNPYIIKSYNTLYKNDSIYNINNKTDLTVTRVKPSIPVNTLLLDSIDDTIHTISENGILYNGVKYKIKGFSYSNSNDDIYEVTYSNDNVLELTGERLHKVYIIDELNGVYLSSDDNSLLRTKYKLSSTNTLPVTDTDVEVILDSDTVENDNSGYVSEIVTTNENIEAEIVIEIK